MADPASLQRADLLIAAIRENTEWCQKLCGMLAIYGPALVVISDDIKDAGDDEDDEDDDFDDDDEDDDDEEDAPPRRRRRRG